VFCLLGFYFCVSEDNEKLSCNPDVGAAAGKNILFAFLLSLSGYQWEAGRGLCLVLLPFFLLLVLTLAALHRKC